MKKHFARKIIAAAAVLVTLCGCADKNPTGPSQPTESWLENHATAVAFPLREATKRNQLLAKELYARFAEVPPIDFTYGGKRFSEDMASWRKDRKTGEGECTVTYTHKETNLSVVLRFRVFADSSAVEWTTKLLHNGTENSLVIEDLKTLSVSFPTKGNTKLFYTAGGEDNEDAFVPHTLSMKEGDRYTLASKGGRSSSGMMPYFNLYTGRDKGFIGAVGWSGQWSVEAAKHDKAVSVCGGMPETRFYLEPGECVSAPSSMLLPWEGEAQDGHNDLRRHMLLYHTPTPEDDRLPLGPISYGVWGGEGADALISQVKAVANRNLGYDILWIDAGWNGDGTKISQSTFDSAWSENVGTWDAIPSLYPKGLREVSDFAHEKGMGMLLWFEPERAFKGTKLAVEHPAWFLGGGSANVIFNLGDEEACAWLTDYVAGLIRQYGVDIYRQDFNIEPLAYWQAADAENRKGITEMKYIAGLYRFWDGLLEKCPGLIIDNCAGGGRRLDFELLSRSVALFRSDYVCHSATATAEANQMQIYGVNFWLPLTGTSSMGRTDSYNFRSTYGFSMQTPNIISKHQEQLALNAEFQKARLYFYGDYYPLTECTVDETDWFAYQMHRPDWDAGFVCAFKRLRADSDQLTVKLSGLTADVTYTVTVSDTGETFTATGAELMKAGLTVTITRMKDSRLLYYEAVGG